jgi:hypothetical protein
MKEKQPFTIGGSVALKKALLEETGIEIQGGGPTPDWAYLSAALFLKSKFDETNRKESIHYQLPQDWDKAVEAVKDFFAEEPAFEKGKWYYAVVSRYEFLFKVKDITDRIFELSEKIMYHPKTGAAYTTDDYVVKYSEVYKNSQPATKEQIHKMLTKVAVQRGLVKAAVVNSIHFNNVTLREGLYVYGADTDTLYFGGQAIYQEGKWADLLPAEPKPEKLVLKDVVLSDVLSIGEDLTFELKQYDRVELHLTATHLQQLKAALAL